MKQAAKKGWILQSFAPLGYTLRKSNPRHLIYSLDYQDVPIEEMEGYYAILEQADGILFVQQEACTFFLLFRERGPFIQAGQRLLKNTSELKG
ncbi:hypothetical protein CJ483_11410 [Bacillus sp. PK3_68]|nr:hypothetical protein CJ483_11410 [Bacillus sp. PK3_68]